MQKSVFQLAKLIAGPAEDIVKPWFIIETFWSSDGPRTRICDGRWGYEFDAQAELERRARGEGRPQPAVPTIPPRNLGGVAYPTPEEAKLDADLGLVDQILARADRVPSRFNGHTPPAEAKPPVATVTNVLNSFPAIMYEQYGSWTFSVGHKDQLEIDRMIISLDARQHVKHITVIDVPFVPAPDAVDGVWVCVFQRYASEWRITNGLANRAAAVKHRDEILKNPKYGEMRFSNVSVRCLPYPEGYRG